MTGFKPAALTTKCPAGHSLVPLGRHFTCDVCQRTSPADAFTVAYCCLGCDFDVCPTHYHPSTTLQEQPAGTFRWLLTQKCAKQHPLQLTTRNVTWFCDVCNMQAPAGAPSAFCAVCDYDCCPAHIGIPVAVPPPPPVTEVSRTLNNNNNSAANLADVQKALNDVAGPFGFQCQSVSWEDAQRGTVGGALSCWGGNISDVRLWERGGRMLYTLRSQNWNERLGYVSSSGVALMVGNEKDGAPLQAVTLQSYLRNLRQHASYAGIDTDSLYDESVDGLLTIRFQTVFLPVAGEALAKTEFCTEVYNYNTQADDDPRNLLLLAMPQGTSVQQDGRGAKKIFFHQVDASMSRAKRYWLEAERSQEKVGGEQKESAEAAQEAWARGKSVAVRIGTKAMGTRFNVQMLIQLPLQQKPRPTPARGGFGGFFGGGALFGSPMPMASCAPTMSCCNSAVYESAPMIADSACTLSFGGGGMKCAKRKSSSSPVIGVSNAARVSRGTKEDVYSGVANKTPRRDPSQHGTITVTMYYTVAGGVPSAADVKSAVEDLDALYKACPSDKRLVDCTEVTAELTVKATQDIGTKVTTQPYKPTPNAMPTDNGFPQ